MAEKSINTYSKHSVVQLRKIIPMQNDKWAVFRMHILTRITANIIFISKQAKTENANQNLCLAKINPIKIPKLL